MCDVSNFRCSILQLTRSKCQDIRETTEQKDTEQEPGPIHDELEQTLIYILQNDNTKI